MSMMMMGILPIAIGIVAVFAIIIPAIIAGRNSGGSALVLKEFKLNENEDEFLKIVGRASGLFSWFFSLFGIEPITNLTCCKESLKFERAAIKYGRKTLNVPLASITGVFSGINKPFILLVLGIIFFLSGIIGAIAARSGIIFILGLIVGVVFIIIYVLNKTMTFGVYCGGDKPIAIISLKKSIIEGQSIDEGKYELAAKALLRAVLDCKK